MLGIQDRATCSAVETRGLTFCWCATCTPQEKDPSAGLHSAIFNPHSVDLLMHEKPWIQNLTQRTHMIKSMQMSLGKGAVAGVHATLMVVASWTRPSHMTATWAITCSAT
jgi:hypothetical protein